MKMYAVRYATILAVFALGAAPAYADWEGTQWGMTPHEAMAVLDGATDHKPIASEIFEFDGAQYEPLLKSSHAIGAIEGEASLLFDAEKTLQFVVFSPDNLDECDALAEELTAIYGPVEPTGFGSTAIYNWDDGDNVIRLTNSADIGICNLSFGAV